MPIKSYDSTTALASTTAYHSGRVTIGQSPPYRGRQEGYTAVTYNTGWVTYTGGGWPGAQYHKDSEGWVHLEGLVQRTSGALTTIFTLPATHRPPFNMQFIAISNDAWCVIDVLFTGAVVHSSGGSAAAFVSLNGIRFPTFTVPGYFDTGIHPQLAAGQGSYSIPNAQVPMIFPRDDGLHRLTSLISPSVDPVTVGYLPESVSRRYHDLYTCYHWTGAANDFARVDIEENRNIVHRDMGGVGASSGTDWGGIGVWSDESVWTTLAMSNSWVDFGSGWAPLRYTRDRDGFVHMSGLIKSGTMTTGTTIATLPVGFRPARRGMFPAYSNGVVQRIDVDTNGIIATGSTWAQNSFVSVANMWFPTF